MLSKASIRPDLKIPGFFGSILGESLRIFERIADRRFKFDRKKIFEEIDSLLLELSAEQEETKSVSPQETKSPAPHRTSFSTLILIAASLPILLLSVLSFFTD
jgi:heptaprenyl diphosphate synthase